MSSFELCTLNEYWLPRKRSEAGQLNSDRFEDHVTCEHVTHTNCSRSEKIEGVMAVIASAWSVFRQDRVESTDKINPPSNGCDCRDF